MTHVQVSVSRVPAPETYALRQRVLRPHQRVEDMGLPGDDDPSTVYLVTPADDGTVVGCLRLQRVACPWRALPGDDRRDADDAWQLRAMAVDENWRGHGLGAGLVTGAVEHVARSGGGLLWCNARLAAQAFYARTGFEVVAGPWEEPRIGLHVGMVREVPA